MSLMRRQASPLFRAGHRPGNRYPILLEIMAKTVEESRSGSPSLPGHKLRQINRLAGRTRRRRLQPCLAAAQAGLSKFHFQRLFKRATGVSPSRYHINLRMNVARRLLRETKKSVVDIALEVGYANPSHFRQTLPQGNWPFPKQLSSAALTYASLRTFRQIQTFSSAVLSKYRDRSEQEHAR